MENNSNIAEVNTAADTATDAVAGVNIAKLSEQHTVTVATGTAATVALPALPLHVQTAALSYVALKEVTDALAKRRVVWEEGAFKSSNAELNSLLADSLAVYLHLDQFDDARMNFHALYKAANFESTKSTSLTTKVVRYVFGENAKKRVFAYVKVLNVALEENVAPEGLAAFIVENGGIEEIRRNGIKAADKVQLREANVKKASSALKSSKPIAANVEAPATLKLKGTTNFVAAIARKEADGTFSIVHITANETLVQSLLANAAKDVAKAEADAEATSYIDNRLNAVNQ